MNVTYCDLCSCVLKEENYYSLYVAEPSGRKETADEYYNYLQKVSKEIKTICPSCKHIFDKIFELRLQRLSELTEEINLIYNLKSKEKK